MDTVIKKIILSNLKKYEKLSAILKYIFVDICEINQDKYFILGSFAIREYRTINDLDINIDVTEFNKLEKATSKNIGHIEFYDGQIRWYYNLTDEYNKLTGSNETDFSIEAFKKLPDIGYPDNNFSLNVLNSCGGLDTDPNGHHFFSLNTLLNWKKTMDRPKDKPDIELIEKIQQKGGIMYKKKSSKKATSSKKKTSKKKSSKKKSSKRVTSKRATSKKATSKKATSKKKTL